APHELVYSAFWFIKSIVTPSVFFSSVCKKIKAIKYSFQKMTAFIIVAVIMPVFTKGVTILNNIPYMDMPSIAVASSKSLGTVSKKLANIYTGHGTQVADSHYAIIHQLSS